MSKEQSSFRHLIHQKIINKLEEVEHWFFEKTKDQYIPFYSSFDIRDSNFKIACVDANIFPAGFNNICEEDQAHTSKLIKNYLEKNHNSVKNIILLAEEHTRNLYYWDNIFVIKSLIEKAGWPTTVCVPGKQIKAPQKITTAGGREISVYLLNEQKDSLIISNNDFSEKYNLAPQSEYNPPLKMGWLSRRKHHFFQEYNLLAEEFAHLLQIDPWHLTIETKLFSPFDMSSKDNLHQLKKETIHIIDHLKKKQQNLQIPDEPYLFLKNNSGTYGLGIMSIHDPESLNQWSYKARKKMKASKGETKINEIIIQEGIPTSLHSLNHQSAEPVIYMLGSEVAGGFLRSHKTKNEKANLNSPGAVFRKMCVSDLKIKLQGLVMENVYSWLGKLGTLAISREIKKI